MKRGRRRTVKPLPWPASKTIRGKFEFLEVSEIQSRNSTRRTTATLSWGCSKKSMRLVDLIEHLGLCLWCLMAWDSMILEAELLEATAPLAAMRLLIRELLRWDVRLSSLRTTSQTMSWLTTELRLHLSRQLRRGLSRDLTRQYQSSRSAKLSKRRDRTHWRGSSKSALTSSWEPTRSSSGHSRSIRSWR